MSESLHSAEKDVTCAGCGKTTTRDDAEGWRFTDAPWCPTCAWLA